MTSCDNNNNDEIKVGYELFDIESGKTYFTLVAPSEVEVLDHDSNKRFRLLKNLIQNHVHPASTWMDVEVSEVQGVTGSGSVWEPSQSKSSRAKKPSDKTGALWGDENTRKFLNAALPHRRELRKFRVPRDVYEEIAKVLNAQIKKEKRIDEYNHAQLRYKVKTLKQTYGEAKQGKHKGDRWIHFWLMYYIYDEDLGLSTSIALDNDQKRNSQFVPPLTPPALSVPNAVPSFVMAPLLSSTLQSTSADVGMINAEAELSPILESLLTPSAAEFFDWGDNGNVEDKAEVSEEDDNGSLEDKSEVVAGNKKKDLPLRSPSKKMVKTANAAVGIHKSPATTPSRKKAKKGALMWPPEQVNGLLSQCNKWKKEIVKERVPPDVWKAISKELKMTDQGSWQLCREKFSQMNRYFIDTILPGKGFLGEDMWAYYEEFCELYDIPEDYHQVINDTSANEEEDDDDYEDVQNNDGSISKRAKWTDDRIILLIDLYKAKSHLFDSTTSSFKHAYLFGQIAVQMQESGIKLSGKQCKSKMSKLRLEYRSEWDKANRTGAPPSKWPFYQKMTELDGGRANMVPPETVSAGRGLIFTEGGKKKSSTEDRGTRTRPPPDYKPKAEKATKVPVYKAKPQQLNERSVEARELLANAVDRMSLDLATTQGERTALLSRLELKLDQLLQMGK